MVAIRPWSRDHTPSNNRQALFNAGAYLFAAKSRAAVQHR